MKGSNYETINGWVIVTKRGNIIGGTFQRTRSKCIKKYVETWPIGWNKMKKTYGVQCLKADCTIQLSANFWP